MSMVRSGQNETFWIKLSNYFDSKSARPAGIENPGHITNLQSKFLGYWEKNRKDPSSRQAQGPAATIRYISTPEHWGKWWNHFPGNGKNPQERLPKLPSGFIELTSGANRYSFGHMSWTYGLIALMGLWSILKPEAYGKNTKYIFRNNKAKNKKNLLLLFS